MGQRGKRPGVIGLGKPLDEKPVDQPPTLTPPFPHPMPPGPEPHPHPHPGLGLGVQLLRNGIVEVPVKMQHTLVDEHTSNGQLFGDRGPPPGSRLGPRRLGLPHTLPNKRKLLGRHTPRPVALPVLAAHTSIGTRRH